MLHTIKGRNIHFVGLFMLFGILVELGVLTVWRGQDNYHLLPILFILGGIIASSAGIFLSFRSPQVRSEARNNKELHLWYIGIFAACSLTIGFYMSFLFLNNPPDPNHSDVIPTIQIMARRLLNFEYPYHPVQFPGWSFSPGYLTMQYLPFVVAEKLQLDYRFLAYMCFVLILLPFLCKGKLTLMHLVPLEAIIKIILPFLCCYLLLIKSSAIFMHSVELIDVAFYLFLAYSLYSRSFYIKGMAIAFCLLSRYGLLFWLPAYGVIYYWVEGWAKTLKLSGVVFGVIMVLYVLPFMTKEPMLFFHGLQNYDKMAVGLWTDVPDWYKHVGKPYTLTQGVGFAIYFLDYWSGEMIDMINALKWVQILASLGVSGCTILLYYFKKDKIKDLSLYLLASFCMYVTIFYSLIFAPFTYLFLVPFFLLFAMLYKIPLYLDHERR